MGKGSIDELSDLVQATIKAWAKGNIDPLQQGNVAIYDKHHYFVIDRYMDGRYYDGADNVYIEEKVTPFEPMGFTFNLPLMYKVLLAALEPHSVYLVETKLSEGNPPHEVILFTGFNTGSYWKLYNNTYDFGFDVYKAYSIKPIKLLHTLEIG